MTKPDPHPALDRCVCELIRVACEATRALEGRHCCNDCTHGLD